MATGRLHVIGAGMAGLAAAVHAAKAGLPVTLYEAANHAGGRCRSFHDTVLDRVIDNGNHLILGGNRAIFEYLDIVGAGMPFAVMDAASFPFLDLATGERWAIRPNAGPLPWWVFVPSRRVPGSHFSDYLTARKLGNSGADATVADATGPSPAMLDRFWQPLSRAVLNTDATRGDALLLWRVMTQTLLKGAGESRPHIALGGLSAALVDPAVDWLRAAGADIRFAARLRAIARDREQATALDFGGDTVALARGDTVVLAVPASEVPSLIPEIAVPDAFNAIVNVHFRCDDRPALPGGGWILGMVGGVAQWVFRRDDILSVTVSDAGDLADRPTETIASTIWNEVARAIGRPEAPLPPHRVVKEHRATIAQTPAQARRRPESNTRWRNLLLAGDWTDTGLPATIEGAVQSGKKAAILAEIKGF
jgi:squalene-associated FAD-dependent desaturase